MEEDLLEKELYGTTGKRTGNLPNIWIFKWKI